MTLLALPMFHLLSKKSSERFSAERMAILTEDNGAFFRYLLYQIFGDTLSRKKQNTVLTIARRSFKKHQEIMEQAFPGRVFPLSESFITNIIEKNISRMLEQDPNAIFLIADRYIAPEIEKKFNGKIFRFSLTYIPKF